jgi:hypothetical protein
MMCAGVFHVRVGVGVGARSEPVLKGEPFASKDILILDLPNLNRIHAACNSLRSSGGPELRSGGGRSAIASNAPPGMQRELHTPIAAACVTAISPCIGAAHSQHSRVRMTVPLAPRNVNKQRCHAREYFHCLRQDARQSFAHFLSLLVMQYMQLPAFNALGNSCRFS